MLTSFLQVQQRLEKLQRELERLSHSAARNSSKKRSELESVKRGTSDVDLILQQQPRDGTVPVGLLCR